MTIDGVIYEQLGIEHQDERRVLRVMFNGDLSDFAARQVKFLEVSQNRDAVLGGHYHDYRELFYVLQGVVVFDLETIDTKERESYTLGVGGRLFIPACVAHRATCIKGSILVGCTEQPFVSAEHNIHKYKF